MTWCCKPWAAHPTARRFTHIPRLGNRSAWRQKWRTTLPAPAAMIANTTISWPSPARAGAYASRATPGAWWAPVCALLRTHRHRYFGVLNSPLRTAVTGMATPEQPAAAKAVPAAAGHRWGMALRARLAKYRLAAIHLNIRRLRRLKLHRAAVLPSLKPAPYLLLCG